MADMGQRRECEFFLLRYVPDAVRNEFVHIGVVLREPGKSQPVEVRFTRDWRRVRCLDPEADVGLLESLEAELQKRFLAEPEGNLFHVLEDSFSLTVQMSAGRAYLAENIPAAVDELMRLYVEPIRRERMPRLSGRAAIQMAMRGEFERAGVWELMRKKVAAADYTRKGDPLRLDCAYRTHVAADADKSARIRMFHAVSLEAGQEMAKVLAFSAAALREGVERVERIPLDLAAVIEPAEKLASLDEHERMEQYQFAVETMQQHAIRVVTTAELAGVAAEARRELGIG